MSGSSSSLRVSGNGAQMTYMEGFLRKKKTTGLKGFRGWETFYFKFLSGKRDRDGIVEFLAYFKEKPQNKDAVPIGMYLCVYFYFFA